MDRSDVSPGHRRWDEVAEKELALNRRRDTFFRLAMVGKTERAYLVDLLVRLSEPQMSVPSPDLSPILLPICPSAP